ncbi:MAG: hypothetical protein EXS05_00405 [Planctomycetaceae bacterium]|nr:hypothetical protein [Planctomycetaceae bacterium]
MIDSALVETTVVIAARHFNPTVFGQIWLAKHGIVAEDEFEPSCLFSEPLVNVASREFNLLVIPDQMQFVPRVEPEKQQQLVSDKVGRIIRVLPHTPFTAMGLNFSWRVTPSEMSVEQFCRRMFFVPNRRLYHRFDAENPRFGAYLSRDILGCRLKLDIKPVTTRSMPIGDTQEWVKFAFNFHLDLLTSENTVEQIEAVLGRWDAARNEAEAIIDEIGDEE